MHIRFYNPGQEGGATIHTDSDVTVRGNTITCDGEMGEARVLASKRDTGWLVFDGVEWIGPFSDMDISSEAPELD